MAPPSGWLGEVIAALSLRAGGISSKPYDSLNLGRATGDSVESVDTNEQRFCDALELPSPPARARLEHGTRIERVDRPGTYGPIDGLLTDRPDLPLWLTVADCVPVYLAGGEWIGLLHAGWRPVVAGAVEAIVTELSDASRLPPGRMRGWIGPGIGACCYPVGPDVGKHFEVEALSIRGGTTHLDLRLAIRQRLQGLGIPDQSIGVSGLCTSCRPDLFFSYRRDGKETGRMAAVCWRR